MYRCDDIVMQNGGFDYIAHEDPDIFCVQETKCAEAELPLVSVCHCIC